MPSFGELNLLDCGACRFDPGGSLPTAAQPATCPHCGKRVAAYVFPALMRAAAPAPAIGTTLIGAESSCFYHAHKRAAVACDVCGRFLCDLCDVQVDGEHRCARCIESECKSRKTTLERYTYYDTIALGIAILGLFLWFFAVVTAPIALFYVIRYWNKPLSVMPRSRWRFVVAAVLAILQLAVFAFFMILPLLNATVP